MKRPRALLGTSGTPTALFSRALRMSMMVAFGSLATMSTARAGVVSPACAALAFDPTLLQTHVCSR